MILFLITGFSHVTRGWPAVNRLTPDGGLRNSTAPIPGLSPAAAQQRCTVMVGEETGMEAGQW